MIKDNIRINEIYPYGIEYMVYLDEVVYKHKDKAVLKRIIDEYYLLNDELEDHVKQARAIKMDLEILYTNSDLYFKKKNKKDEG